MPDDTPRGRLFDELAAIATTLRGENGCPWDREQTLSTLVPYLIEEAHEVAESIAAGAASELRAELGDLLFLILMMSAISEERGDFRLDDVLAGAAEKMRRRHPHVFGDVQVGGSGDVVRNWEAIKQSEQTTRASRLEGVPKTLPALLRARRVQEKAAHAGFDWPTSDGPLAKIDEEARELRDRLGDSEGAAAELGDLLFSVVNLSRFLRLNPEEALHGSTEKFARRFRRVEAAMARSERPLTLEEMDRVWDEAKREE
jgi:tetrapyrrole methylase family protein/MazG family protein